MAALNRAFSSFSRQLEKRTSKKNMMKALDELLTCTRHLSGVCYDSVLLLYWNYDHGLLHKLNSYAALFSRNSSQEGSVPQRTYNNTSQALRCSVQLHDALLALNGTAVTSWKNQLPQLEVLVNKMMLHINRVRKALQTTLKQFSSDENVIFFVLRHSQEIDDIFAPGFVKDTLTKLYPKGLSEAKKLLSQKYRSRGFNQLLPIISTKIDNLQQQ